jgi:hypothetical protein
MNRFCNYAEVAAGPDVPGAQAVHASLRERFPHTKRRAEPADIG